MVCVCVCCDHQQAHQTAISFSVSQPTTGIDQDEDALTEAAREMADDQQYQDEGRSAAKTLWLGDVQVSLRCGASTSGFAKKKARPGEGWLMYESRGIGEF